MRFSVLPKRSNRFKPKRGANYFLTRPAEVVCKLCNNMMPNPVIEYGVFTGWCVPCIRSRCSKKAVSRMVKKEQGAFIEPGKSRLAGVAPPLPAAERMAPNSAGITTNNGKPHLTLSSYLIHG